MNSLTKLWRTTTFRLTAFFALTFVIFSILLLAFISYQSSIQLQRQQTADIDREVEQIVRIDRVRGFRAAILAVSRLASAPGPGIYYLGDPSGLPIVGNFATFPVAVLQTPGIYSFNYDRPPPFEDRGRRPLSREGFAVVRSAVLDSGLRLVIGRDVVERRGFSQIIVQTFLWGVAGILLASVLAGIFTAARVLRRIDTISGTATKIMSGNLSERVPVTRRNDEFDALATNLNLMLDRIEQLMQGLKEVTDNVAHDLKTPLTRLRNKAEAALREGAGQDTRRDALETTIQESDKLIRTFNALLMIARAEAGAPSGALADIDVSAVVSDVAELYDPVAEEEGMTLVSSITEGLHLRGNRELLVQAVVNLVENAIKYGHAATGESRVSISLRREAERVLIEVADDGKGIPEADRLRVLERFVRLDTSRSETGSGLGLSLVAAVARLHRGSFRIEDNAPGMRAIIDLPAT